MKSVKGLFLTLLLLILTAGCDQPAQEKEQDQTADEGDAPSFASTLPACGEMTQPGLYLWLDLEDPVLQDAPPAPVISMDGPGLPSELPLCRSDDMLVYAAPFMGSVFWEVEGTFRFNFTVASPLTMVHVREDGTQEGLSGSHSLPNREASNWLIQSSGEKPPPPSREEG